MAYRLGRKSLKELDGVHPALVGVVKGAIKITEQDFTVHDGIRTIAEQEEYVRTGVSWTMKSLHLPQKDGLSHAVDLVPYINGRLRWEWGPIYMIAKAVQQVARERHVPLVWGGVWDRSFNNLADPLQNQVNAYGDRRRAKRKKVNIDGPHFQLAAKYRR